MSGSITSTGSRVVGISPLCRGSRGSGHPRFIRPFIPGFIEPFIVAALVDSHARPYDGMVMAVGSRPFVPSRLAPGGVAHGSRRTPTPVLRRHIALTQPPILESPRITTAL